MWYWYMGFKTSSALMIYIAKAKRMWTLFRFYGCVYLCFLRMVFFFHRKYFWRGRNLGSNCGSGCLSFARPQQNVVCELRCQVCGEVGGCDCVLITDNFTNTTA